MITITIKQSGSKKFTVKENCITKSTPTQYTEDANYGNKKKVATTNEYAVQEVEKVENWERVVLEQRIAEDGDFDMAAVIKAINKL